MRSISDELRSHIGEEVTTLATCWKLTRRDALVMGFTDCDKDLMLDEVDYIAATGFTPTAVQNSAALNVDNLDVEGLLDAGSITEEDLLAGLYDYAEIDVFMVNYTDLSQGTLHLKTGWLGEVTLHNGQFVAEVRGLTQPLSQRIGALYAPACRAQLGDARCMVAIEAYQYAGSVTAAIDRSSLMDGACEQESGYFSYGRMRFTSGANDGLAMEIKEYTNGQFILTLPMPYTIELGDQFIAEAGCDKTIKTCAERFDNALNFRGEPHVPGLDRMLETASTRSEWE